MFFLGLLDCLCLLGNSFVTGYLHIVGSVFCTHPNLQYITGCILVGCWFGETFGCALLALDRCLVFASPRLSKFLFEQKRIYLWIAAMFIYALSFAVF
ncbi:hypothetical protein L596_029318 [Steinernema carpocapsae]|uniref:G-protein coupled receptors family 1 profile domain-containing protein n=1 Tax=Steinernema carpocapsae TaxID=34508 RepID=A0A4U5LUA2_STECR|nr:hypothetical protein L596_029318 [Steinernema carpocapsae]